MCVHTLHGWPGLLIFAKRWRLDVSQVTYTEVRRRLWCPLLFHESLWSERLRWFKRAQGIWRDWYGSLGMWLITCLCSECVCVCVFQFEDVFPYAFCVCSTRMREDFVVMLANKVRHFCRRPHLVSAGILCSSASTHFCSLSFYPFLILSERGNRECLFFISYALSLHLHHLPPLVYALPHPWLVLWQRGNRACSPLTASRLIEPLCQPCTRLPEEATSLVFLV